MIDTLKDIPTFDSKGKPIKKPDGSPVTRSEVVKRLNQITYTCKGSVFRVFYRCIFDKTTPAGCPPAPPQPPPPNISQIVRHELQAGTIDLPLPNPAFTPRVSHVAPLVGVKFFYGLTSDDFYKITGDRLSICFDQGDECASLIISAKPMILMVDPGASLADASVRASCNRPIPVVFNRKTAGEASDDCALTFQKAGRFPMQFTLVYNVTWSLNEWSFVVGPPSVQGSMQTDVTVDYVMAVKQRQPVVIG